MSKLTHAADKWMEAGLEAHELHRTRIQQAKETALMAGFYFLKAKASFAHGEWQAYLQNFAGRLSVRTIRDYCAFTGDAIAQASRNNPKVTHPEKLLDLAKTMVLESPKSYITLLRDIRQFPQHGEYDADRYAMTKLKGGQQTEFPFSYETVIQHLEIIDRAPNAAKLSRTAIETLKARCESTSEWCAAQLATLVERENKKLKLIEA